MLPFVNCLSSRCTRTTSLWFSWTAAVLRLIYSMVCGCYSPRAFTGIGKFNIYYLKISRHPYLAYKKILFQLMHCKFWQKIINCVNLICICILWVDCGTICTVCCIDIHIYIWVICRIYLYYEIYSLSVGGLWDYLYCVLYWYSPDQLINPDYLSTLYNHTVGWNDYLSSLYCRVEWLLVYTLHSTVGWRYLALFLRFKSCCRSGIFLGVQF